MVQSAGRIVCMAGVLAVVCGALECLCWASGPGIEQSPWTMFLGQNDGPPGSLPDSYGENGAVQHEPVYLPAEFDPQEALVLSAGLLAQRYPPLLVQIVEALQGHTSVVGLVSDAQQREKAEKLLAAQKLLGRGVRLVEIPHNTLWIRDYGPIFFRFPDTHPGAYDAEYPEPGRRLDDAVPVKLAALFGASVFPLPMVLEGGNLLTNGRGLCLSTTAAVLRHGGPSATEASFRQVLYQSLGIESLVILEPLSGEPTGHVDMFACFTTPDTVVVAQCDAKEDPENAAILDRNAAVLAGCQTSAGPLRVVRIPLGPHKDGVWRSYTNVAFSNRLVLVPIYPATDPAGGTKALEIFSRALPGWKVMGIDASELIRAGGALRCVTLGVPAPTEARSLRAAVGHAFPLAGAHTPWAARSNPRGRLGEK